MKHTFLFCVIMSIACSLAMAETIGENYEGGGTVIGGSAYVYSSLGGYWAVSVYPSVDWLLADGLVLGVGLSIYVNSDDPLQIGVTPSIGYIFGYDPDAAAGPAHRIQLNGNVGLDFNGPFIYGSLTPYYQFYYFLAPRIAPYIQLSAVSIYFSSGFDVVTYLRAAFGVSFHVPNKDRIIEAVR